MAIPNGSGGYQVGDGNLNDPLIDALPDPVAIAEAEGERMRLEAANAAAAAVAAAASGSRVRATVAAAAGSPASSAFPPSVPSLAAAVSLSASALRTALAPSPPLARPGGFKGGSSC